MGGGAPAEAEGGVVGVVTGAAGGGGGAAGSVVVGGVNGGRLVIFPYSSVKGIVGLSALDGVAAINAEKIASNNMVVVDIIFLIFISRLLMRTML